jgi:hypothetical protein
MEKKATIVKREMMSSNKQTCQNVLGSLHYRSDTSVLHRFISALNNKHSENHNAPINSKNSTKYKAKT